MAPVAAGVLNIEPAAPAALAVDFDLGAGSTYAIAQPDINLDAVAPSQAEPAPGWLDFDLGLGGEKQSAAAPAADLKLNVDFNLPDAGNKPAQPAVSDSGGIDFDLGLPAVGDTAAEAPKAPALDLMSTISLDLGMPGGGNGSGGAPDARWQEVATKLDLAKAYEEMGDKDGARELLKEVMKEGDTAQQQKAQTMLQALG
jgi:pilus assembly protein FimV